MRLGVRTVPQDQILVPGFAQAECELLQLKPIKKTDKNRPSTRKKCPLSEGGSKKKKKPIVFSPFTSNAISSPLGSSPSSSSHDGHRALVSTVTHSCMERYKR